MTDVELVIKIPEEFLRKIDDKNYQSVISWYDTTLYCAIKNGTPHPRTGHWIIVEELRGEWEGAKKYACDKCGEKVGVFKSNYCPNCGVKMMVQEVKK